MECKPGELAMAAWALAVLGEVIAIRTFRRSLTLVLAEGLTLTAVA